MIKLQANYPQYFDTDGSPLEGGSIYFGTAGLNPETSPITVFKDQAGTLAVAQPLRTVNGSIVHSGAPIHVFAEVTDYSYTVRNKRGELVSTTLHFLQDIGAAASMVYAEQSAASAAASEASATAAEAQADAAASSAIASQASADSAAATFSGETLVDNGEIINVIRRAGTLPPATFTAGQFVIDRWKAGSAGMTRAYPTFDIAGDVRIISGTMVQTVYAPNGFSAFGPGDQVTVAWDGPSQMRFNGGAYSSSPYTHTFTSGAGSFTIEFNNAGGGTDSGTVSKVRAYRGNLDKGLTSKSLTDYKIHLSRYYQEYAFDRQVLMSAGAIDRTTCSISQMVAIPTITLGTVTQSVNVSAFTFATSETLIRAQIVATAAGNTWQACTLRLDTGI